MKSQSDPERGMRALTAEMCIQKWGLGVRWMGGAVESQRRADPMRIRNEVSMEFLERAG